MKRFMFWRALNISENIKIIELEHGTIIAQAPEEHKICLFSYVDLQIFF